MGLNIKLDTEEAETILVRFIRDYVRGAGLDGVVLGLSGGIDSAVVAALATRALGPENVHAFWLPSDVNDPKDLDDALAVAKGLGITPHVHGIGPIVEAFTARLEEDRQGTTRKDIVANIMARSRMVLLYAEAAGRNALVIGTGNKTELLVGYFTKYGDGGADLLPIGDLYKAQVRELAAHLGVPAAVVEKPPSAGLWGGQVDEDDLGITYEKLDKILIGLEIDLPFDRIAEEAAVSLDEVHRIERLRAINQHKRSPPLVCKMGIRSLTSDWRDPVQGALPPRDISDV